MEGKADFADRVQAIAEYVQNRIRYVAIEIGVGGYQPHAASDIFRLQYGDCKDKATLLSAMLNAIGVRATWVMVDTERGVMVPEAPSTDANHMIAAIQLPQGYRSERLQSIVQVTNGERYLIFDPTWEKTPFGQLESGLQGGYGLLMDGNNSQLVALPVLQPESNRVTRVGRFVLTPEGNLTGQITEERKGDIASYRRNVYTNWNAKEQSAFLDDVIANDLTDFHIGGVKVENVQDLQKALTVSYSLQSSRFGRVAGPLMMARPRVLFTDGMHLDHKERTLPIDLSETRRVEDRYEIELPAGYAVEEMPPPVKLDLGFAMYESDSEMHSGKLQYTRLYQVRQITLPAAQYNELQQMAGAIAMDESSTAILKRIQ